MIWNIVTQLWNSIVLWFVNVLSHAGVQALMLVVILVVVASVTAYWLQAKENKHVLH